MTLLVGIRCSDGVVVAADQAVTFGDGARPTISHRACKIEVVQNAVIVAGTGQVGMKQRLVERVDQLWAVQPGKLECIKAGKTPIEICNTICSEMVNSFATTKANMGVFGALVAFPHSKSGSQLCEFATTDFQPELKDKGTWFVSMGSGQSLADPYLAFMKHVYWQDGMPKMEHALFAATWVMVMSITVAPGQVALPIDIAVLTDKTARMLSAEQVSVHMEAAKAATEHFGRFDPAKMDVGEAAPEGPAPAIPNLTGTIPIPKPGPATT